MKKRWLTGIIVYIASSLAQSFPQQNSIWIGNSLSAGGFGCGQGWQTPAYMCNPDSLRTERILAMHNCILGATPLWSHWNQGSALAEMSTPVVWNPYDIWHEQPADHYEFLVLQPYTCHDSASTAKEKKALIQYCDTAIALGVKPLLYACWESPDRYTPVMAMYLDVWERYKADGALLAPLFDAHRLVLRTKPLTYLYSDATEHPTYVAAYLNSLITHYLLTGIKPTEYHLSQLVNATWPYNCTVPNDVIADAAFLAEQAEEALALYYPIHGTGLRPRAKSHTSPVTLQARRPAAHVDIRGRKIIVQDTHVLVGKSGIVFKVGP
jgi:hypothetical protein